MDYVRRAFNRRVYWFIMTQCYIAGVEAFYNRTQYCATVVGSCQAWNYIIYMLVTQNVFSIFQSTCKLANLAVSIIQLSLVNRFLSSWALYAFRSENGLWAFYHTSASMMTRWFLLYKAFSFSPMIIHKSFFFFYENVKKKEKNRYQTELIWY